MSAAEERTGAARSQEADAPDGVRLLHGTGPAARWLPRTPFRMRPPWFGGDLQTLRNIVASLPRPAGAERRHLLVALPEPGAGSLSATLDLPVRPRRREIILLVHGLGGCETSAYMRLAAAGFLADGHRVLRINLRGAGPSAATAPGPYHAGLTEDLAAVLSRLDALFPGRPVLAVGFSLGGHLLLRLAAEDAGGRRPAAIATVSAPLDLATTQRRFAAPRNRLYQRHIVGGMLRDLRQWPAWAAHPAASPGGPRSIRDFDRRVVVPAHGFDDVETYYASMSVRSRLEHLSGPTLILHADDDPWIPAESYERAPWPEDAELCVAITRGGGHVGFHAAGCAEPWYVIAVRNFRDALFGFAPPGGAEQAAQQQHPDPGRQ